jgi:hypothetical protein
MPIGALSRNEVREIFNMAPIEGGDKYLVSLNYVDADQQNNYQGVGGDGKNGGKGQGLPGGGSPGGAGDGGEEDG